MFKPTLQFFISQSCIITVRTLRNHQCIHLFFWLKVPPSARRQRGQGCLPSAPSSWHGTHEHFVQAVHGFLKFLSTSRLLLYFQYPDCIQVLCSCHSKALRRPTEQRQWTSSTFCFLWALSNVIVESGSLTALLQAPLGLAACGVSADRR